MRAAHTDALVPVQTEPLERVDDLVEGFLGITGGVRILDTENEGTANMTRVGVVEETGAHHTHVRGTGGRRTEANADI